MKCIKCGSDTPYSATSSLCPPCTSRREPVSIPKGAIVFCILFFIAVIYLVLVHTLISFICVFLGFPFALGIWMGIKKQKMSPSQRNTMDFGSLNSQLICPHCQRKEMVRVRPIKRKAGVSGTKAMVNTPSDFRCAHMEPDREVDPLFCLKLLTPIGKTVSSVAE